MNETQIQKIIAAVNKGALRKSSIPAELASGWPCIHCVGEIPCVTIPYFFRTRSADTVLLYPLYCSVTVPIKSPSKTVDFTIYKYHSDWKEIDYDKPCGYFRHEALKDVTKEQYKQMCEKLFEYYDVIIERVLSGMEPEENEDMTRLFSALMEPSHFEQYLKINKRFYSGYCNL